MSSSSGHNEAKLTPITALRYREIGNGQYGLNARTEDISDSDAAPVDDRIAEVDMTAVIQQERAAAVHETELRLQREIEQKLVAGRAPLSAALAAFTEQRNDYFARVEAEVVQLALSIAAKILHREAQVDTMLVASLVRMAIEKMREGSAVVVRVNPAKSASWRQYLAAQSSTEHVSVVEDAKLNDQDCLLETELGSANFGLDTQLKEVEQGFFDLLALRPAIR